MQLTGQGQQPAVAGLAQLLTVCSPIVAVVVGIAGSLHPEVGADEHKHDRDQAKAARRAVAVLMDLIPYLAP